VQILHKQTVSQKVIIKMVPQELAELFSFLQVVWEPKPARGLHIVKASTYSKVLLRNRSISTTSDTCLVTIKHEAKSSTFPAGTKDLQLFIGRKVFSCYLSTLAGGKAPSIVLVEQTMQTNLGKHWT